MRLLFILALFLISDFAAAKPCSKNPWSLWSMKAVHRFDDGEYIATIPSGGTIEYKGKLYQYAVVKPLATKDAFDQHMYFKMHRALSGFFEPVEVIDLKKADGFKTTAVSFVQCEK